MLDMRQAERLVAQLREAAERPTQPIDPALPLEMARAAKSKRPSERCSATRRGGGGVAFRPRRRGRERGARWLKAACPVVRLKADTTRRTT